MPADCHKLPAGKRLAVAGVWVDESSTSNADIDEDVATSTSCSLLLSLRTSRAALVNGSQCLTEDDVDMLVLTNASTLAANQKAQYDAAGLIVKDVAASPAMKAYAVSSAVKAPTDVIHMFKLAPLWDTDYAVVLVSDTDAFVHPGKHGKEPMDLFNAMLDPKAPTIVYSHGTSSPFNAGMVLMKPTKKAYKLFESGVKNLFEYGAVGWGGQYDRTMLDKLQEFSKVYKKGLTDAQKMSWRNSDRVACMKDDAVWCFIGCNQDQGMYAHIVASKGDDGELIIPSMDMRENVDDPKKEKATGDISAPGSIGFLYNHYAFSPKPWNIPAWAEVVADKGKVADHSHIQVTNFWSMYSLFYSETWNKVPAPYSKQCPSRYACFFNQMLSLDEKMKSEDDVGPTGLPIKRDSILAHLEKESCAALS